ncbi:MAG: autotransporter domain-containing protein, partial [Opitutales bacterium]|nr:autotransporter domain-containing protein [Opitutales bacterium]
IYGNVIVHSGITLLPAGNLSNIESIVLVGAAESLNESTSGIESRLATVDFGNKSQVLNNLIGDTYSRLKTGTASRIELAIDEGNYTGELDLSAVNYGIFGTFGGRIEGYGNIVKSGAGTLNLTGSLGAATNYGALVIKQGALVGGTAQILGNASALILNTDTTASFVGDQSLVALYGVAGTSVTLADETGAAGNLLLGESVSRRSELPNVSNPATNYLSLADDRTLYAGQTDVTVAFKPFLELAGAGTELYEALEKFAQSSPMSVSQYDLVRDLFGDSALTSVATLTERHLTTAYLNLLNANGDLDSAEAQFAGDVVANTIIKIGASEQSLLGKITASAIRVEGGKLTIGGDSLQNETALEVNRGAEISIVVAGANSTNAVTINGDGDIRILSDVDLDLSSQFANTTTGAITLVGTHPTETVEFSMALRNATLSLGAQGDITVENANLALNQTSNVDWSNSLVVDGDLIKQGSGKLTLTSNNSSVTGTVSVEEGELDLVGWENAGAATYGALDVAAGATLNLNVATATNFAGTTNGAGTIVKSGSDTLTLTGAAGTFAGTLSIDAGSLVVATANYFDAATTVSVASGAQLTLNSDQKFASLDGAGTISLAASVTLTLAFDDASTAIVIDNSSGHYVATIPTAYVGSFTGALAGGASSAIAVGGTGAFDFSAATIAAGIAINVSDGQLVLPAAAANSDSVTVTDGELVYSVLAGATDNLGNVVQLPLNIGKVGAGTLALSSSQIANTAIAVYEGALTVSGSDVFSFNTLKLAQGTTLNISYSGSDSDIDLSKIEGSGTVVFTNTGTAFSSLDLGGMSMLPTTGTRYFNGSIRFEGVNLVVGNDVTVTALGLDAASNLQVNNNATLTITQSDNTALAGAVTIQDGSEICVTSLRDGNGDYYVLSLTNDSISGDIRVKNGALQLNQSENLAGGTLTAQGSADLYFNVPSGSVAPTTLTNANVDVSLATSVRFIKTGAGTMKLDGASPAAFAKVSWTPLSPMAAGGSTPSVPTILGVNEGQLILNNVDRMASNIGLATYAAGTLVLDGAQTLDRSVSGDGAVEKRGAGVLTVASNQAFTGAFTLSAGTTVFADNPTLATSQLILAGSAKASGAVTLTDAGTTSALAIAAGAKYSLAADETIAYAGTLNVADINGTIEVTGTSSATPIVLLQATTAQGDLSVAAQRALANRISLNMAGANRFMLSQSAGTVTLYTVGSSLSSSLNLHDGLDGFVGLLDAALPAGNVVEADLTDSLLVSLLRSGTASAGTAIENLSPLSYSAMVVMSRTGHNNDINQFRDRATARRFELANDYADIGWQFWVTAQGSFVKSGSGHNAAVYDYNVYGALVGADIKLDDYTLMGVGLGCDYGVANIHNGGGKIKSDDYRLTIYGSSLLGDGSWFADYGVSGAFSSYDIKRKTLVGNAESEPDGYSLGAYGILGRGILLSVDRDERLILTPYAGLSVYYTKVGAEKETGGAGLDIDDISAWSVRGLLGASLDWVFPCGDYDARLGLDATFAHEFADDEIDLDTTYSGKKCTVQSAGGSTNTLSIGPSAALSLGLHTSIRMAYRLEVGVDEDVAHNVNFGFRHSF